MVDNLVEKGDECPLIINRGHCFVQLSPRRLSVIWSNGVSAIQGLLKY